MAITRHPLSRRDFLQASAVTVGAAVLAGALPRMVFAQANGAMAQMGNIGNTLGTPVMVAV